METLDGTRSLRGGSLHGWARRVVVEREDGGIKVEAYQEHQNAARGQHARRRKALRVDRGRRRLRAVQGALEPEETTLVPASSVDGPPSSNL
jgi:hypothetical protein